MSLEELGSLGEFIGAMGVVVSLIYLALQVRQNTRHLHNSTRSMQDAALLATRSFANEFNAYLIADGELTRVFRLGIGASTKLTPDERIRFDLLIAQWFYNAETLFLFHERGSLELGQWVPVKTRMAMMLATPGAQQWWGKQAQTMGTAFREFVDTELLAARPAA